MSAAAIDAVITRLQASGVLDESRMARAAARLETVVRGRGPARARQKLKSLGLSDRDVEQALDAALEDVDVATLLDRALEKRLRREKGDVRDAATVRRVVGSLVRQGFAPGAILARLRARGTDRRQRRIAAPARAGERHVSPALAPSPQPLVP